jgi:uncharacterized membrane protein
MDLDDAYDDYEGPVKCFACRATLEIRTEQGSLRAAKQVYAARHISTGEAFEPVRRPLNRAPKEGA